MERRIHQLLRERLEGTKTLNESIKIKRGEANRYGYFVFITSDNPNVSEASKETSKMGNVLNLSKAKANQWDKLFNPPKHYSDRATGRFGWGYLITDKMNDEQSNRLISNLKELVDDYNKSQQLEADLETQGLNANQIERIQKIVQAVETSEKLTSNTEAKANLDKYLTELENAIENDEVYEFLIKTFQDVKTFQQNNPWEYSILNALIIRQSDPQAVIAGPKQYWDERNYKIKDEFLNNGIVITKRGAAASDIKDKVDYFRKNPGAFEEFKRERNLPASVSFDTFAKSNAYQLATYATKNNLVSSKVQFTPVFTYTDRMVEPIPGKEVEPIVSGGELDYIPEKGISSQEDAAKVKSISNSVSKVAAKMGIASQGLSDNDDINTLNKVLNTMALSFVTERLKYRLKDRERQGETQELFKAYAEAVSHIIKRHYGLPSESSKYNIASLGGDREAIQKESNVIIGIADKLIGEINANIKSTTNQINEIRKLVKSILKDII